MIDAFLPLGRVMPHSEIHAWLSHTNDTLEVLKRSVARDEQERDMAQLTACNVTVTCWRRLARRYSIVT